MGMAPRGHKGTENLSKAEEEQNQQQEEKEQLERDCESAEEINKNEYDTVKIVYFNARSLFNKFDHLSYKILI